MAVMSEEAMTGSSARRRKMLVLCPFPQGVAAGQRLKYEQYFDDWRAAGYEITVSPFMNMDTWRIAYEPGNYLQKGLGVLRGHWRRVKDLFRVRHYDLVYVFMWVTPFGSTIFERLVRRLARKLVFDVEDSVIIDTKSIDTKEVIHPIARLIRSPGKARHLIRTADHVITSSPFLNDTCLGINEKRACTYITSSVNTDRFLPATSRSTAAPVTIGWTGTFSSKVYLDLLREMFPKLAKRIDFRLKVIGNFDYELPGIELEVVRWSAEREVEDLQSFDIGVYPLPIDEWVLGKSGLKAIQYMALGIPTVATRVGTTPLIIRDGENGLLVDTEEEWLDALERLVRDPELRQRLGQAARLDAEALYSTKAVAALYRGVLASVMGPIE